MSDKRMLRHRRAKSFESETNSSIKHYFSVSLINLLLIFPC